IEKTSNQICEILVDMYLYPDEDFIDFMEQDIKNIGDKKIDSYNEKDDLIISRVLNLNAKVFINNLDKIIEDNSLEENSVKK
ncbi:4020_t:CDS:1, partial [Funneliformis mosseae]